MAVPSAPPNRCRIVHQDDHLERRCVLNEYYYRTEYICNGLPGVVGVSYRSALNVQYSNCGQVGLLYWEDESEWKTRQLFLDEDAELPEDIEAPFFECGSCGELSPTFRVIGADGEVILR